MMHRFRFFTTLQSLPHASTVTALSTAYTPITGACLDLLPPSLSWPLAVCLRVINRRDLEAVEVVRANAERFGWSLDERRGSANAAAHVVRVAVALSKRREDWMCLKEAAEREPLTADVLRGCRGVRGDLRGAGGLRGDA